MDERECASTFRCEAMVWRQVNAGGGTAIQRGRYEGFRKEKTTKREDQKEEEKLLCVSGDAVRESRVTGRCRSSKRRKYDGINQPESE